MKKCIEKVSIDAYELKEKKLSGLVAKGNTIPVSRSQMI